MGPQRKVKTSRVRAKEVMRDIVLFFVRARLPGIAYLGCWHETGSVPGGTRGFRQGHTVKIVVRGISRQIIYSADGSGHPVEVSAVGTEQPNSMTQ